MEPASVKAKKQQTIFSPELYRAKHGYRIQDSIGNRVIPKIASSGTLIGSHQENYNPQPNTDRVLHYRTAVSGDKTSFPRDSADFHTL